MEKLPEVWHINIEEEVNNDLLWNFRRWYTPLFKGVGGVAPNFMSDCYGFDGKRYLCTTKGEKLTLMQWYNCIFGEQFKKGEEVLVRDHESEGWDKAIFITEFEGKYLVKWCGDFEIYSQCKKKPSELDIKIEELKKLAEGKGVKLTVICE